MNWPTPSAASSTQSSKMQRFLVVVVVVTFVVFVRLIVDVCNFKKPRLWWWRWKWRWGEFKPFGQAIPNLNKSSEGLVILPRYGARLCIGIFGIAGMLVIVQDGYWWLIVFCPRQIGWLGPKVVIRRWKPTRSHRQTCQQWWTQPQRHCVQGTHCGISTCNSASSVLFLIRLWLRP